MFSVEYISFTFDCEVLDVEHHEMVKLNSRILGLIGSGFVINISELGEKNMGTMRALPVDRGSAQLLRPK